MSNEIHLLIFILIDKEMCRIAAKIDSDQYQELDMQYYNENDNLKQHLKFNKEDVILRLEEIHDILT